jgi:hypothetical protein
VRSICRVLLGVCTTLSLALSIPAIARATTVAGLWHMDEHAGNIAADSSGHHNDGHLQNVQLVSGAFGFNGHNSRILVPDDASLDPGNADITISVKVKFTVKPSHSVHDYDVVRKGGNGNYYKIEIANTGRARCQFHGTSGGQGLVLGPDLSNGQWHTIQCTKTGSRIEGKVDGHSASRGAHIGNISNGTALSLGGKASGTQDLYQGLMDEVRITIG